LGLIDALHRVQGREARAMFFALLFPIGNTRLIRILSSQGGGSAGAGSAAERRPSG